MTIQTDTPHRWSPPASCPYLGMRHDAATHCTFATNGHRCYGTGKSSPVTIDQQLSLCLTPRHTACPIYAGRPPGHRTGTRLARVSRPVVGILTVTVAAATAAAILARRPAAGDRAGAADQGGAPMVTATAAVTTTAAGTASGPSITAPATATATPPPTRYRVRAGDTLAAIAMFFGARQQDIIALNNLPRDGGVQTGQELIIPDAR